MPAQEQMIAFFAITVNGKDETNALRSPGGKRLALHCKAAVSIVSWVMN
jgi:hypothetical protein